ncbi:cob(I)yrinic acid a,c-diamide adenosyltransferase [Pontibacillus litoralis]|uniref:Corrinoid adenosyltransferase n=1 Tax=Pontibacillus litoralis JSM 072002 TaxID=1385512 RepID=A0A0A5GA88_9BACI|nr:cob(I)yrinic acid a,c-diamide adenosyltransferase [Pontibacillus litoralis]KGX88108.1 ATP:cob(I)alamin adenosyltransferase [Pontibacillus litoralis JSM 072002]
MRIYTRGGDKGATSLIYGVRVPKNDARVDAYGTCDEANSMIGVALSHLKKEDIVDGEAFMEMMHRVQTILFHVGAELATPKGKQVKWQVKQSHIEELEKQIDNWDEALPPLQNFILPSGHPASAALHTARTIVRRAERSAVAIQDELNNPLVISYLNRLSDFLFVAARYVNQITGGEEIPLQVDV